ncbi:MAG TPA: hypothetical protein VNZ27_00430 [Rhodanobacter sp.]|jgi:hypothetical protein|nr:hypothetical protein [Rhodanobacter sp.]
MTASPTESELYRSSYAAFLDEYAALHSTKPNPFSYELSDQAEHAEWRIPLLGCLIGGELREALNDIHQWEGQLLSLQAWTQMLVKSDLDEQAQWTVRLHFVEPVATWCLLQPSATRDRLGNIANATS